MASIVIAGDTSGSVTISAPAIAGTPTLTLPTSSGTIAVTGGSPSFATLTVTGDASISGLTVGKGGGAVATNTAVGASALAANTSGDSNVAIGFSALVANTTGTYNVSVGRNSLLSNTTGSSNSALGHTALNSNTTGGSSTAIGFQALYSNTTASNNTAVGYQAGYSNTTGAGNVFLGQVAGRSVTTNAYNTFIGTGTGYSATGGGNTFIGTLGSDGSVGCGYYMTTGSNNVIIGGFTGQYSSLDIRTSNQYIVLSDGLGNPRGIFDNNGRFIVGGTAVLTASEITSYNSGNCHLATRNTNASSGFYWRYEVDSSNTIYIINHNSTGVYISNGGTSWTSISDERLKTNLQPIQNAAEKVSRLRAVTGRYKTDNDDVNRAFLIAQDVQAVLPEAVTENSEGYLGLAYTETIPLLVAAIKELNAKVEAQAAEIAALKGAN